LGFDVSEFLNELWSHQSSVLLISDVHGASIERMVSTRSVEMQERGICKDLRGVGLTQSLTRRKVGICLDPRQWLAGMQPLESITRYHRNSTFRVVFCAPFHMIMVCHFVASVSLKIEKMD
jgi:hypothetical protein